LTPSFERADWAPTMSKRLCVRLEDGAARRRSLGRRPRSAKNGNASAADVDKRFVARFGMCRGLAARVVGTFGPPNKAIIETWTWSTPIATSVISRRREQMLPNLGPVQMADIPYIMHESGKKTKTREEF